MSPGREAVLDNLRNVLLPEVARSLPLGSFLFLKTIRWLEAPDSRLGPFLKPNGTGCSPFPGAGRRTVWSEAFGPDPGAMALRGSQVSSCPDSPSAERTGSGTISANSSTWGRFLAAATARPSTTHPTATIRPRRNVPDHRRPRGLGSFGGDERARPVGRSEGSCITATAESMG